MSQRKRLTGTVKWFSGQRRYGFVAPDIGGEDLFVHYNSIRSEGSRMLTQGDVVEFSVEKGENGRMKAVNVTGPAGTEIPVGASSGGGGFSGWSKGGGVGREEFGRGGGRSWGRNGRAVGGPCYNCGQNGHLARDCPRSYQGGAGGGGACFNCGQSGHLARDCKQTNGSNSRGFGGACYNCGQSGQNGHLARDCPRSYQEGAGGGGACFNCGQSGHLARDCEQTSGSNSRGFGGSCYNCGQSGHLARDCKQERANFVNFSIGGYSGGGRGCYNCGEPGHLARDCPNNDDN